MLVDINVFKADATKYTVEGALSDGIEAHRCSIASHICADFLSKGPAVCSEELLHGSKGESKEAVKKAYCRRFKSFIGSCEVEVAVSSSARGDGDESLQGVSFSATVVGFHPRSST